MRSADSQVRLERSRFTLAVRSLLGGIWFSLWFFAAFPGGLLYLFGESLIPPPGLNRFVGLACIAAPQIILVALIARFVRQGGGTPVPLDPPTEMISQGLYSRVRNPMYAAYIATALGEAILYRSGILLGYTVGFALLVHAYVARIEEPKLRARFGAPYERYCEMSGRWLPRL